MFFSDARKVLDETKEEAQSIANTAGVRTSIFSIDNAATFFGSIHYSFRLIWEEKEILLFALMQWLSIAIAYVLWTQMLDWIPDELWQEVSRKGEDGKGAFHLINLVLLGWSFFVVMVVSYPLSLFNSAMIAAHYLRASGQPSTIARCLELSARNLGRVWIFTTIDAWVTVNAILDRLPKKRGRRRTSLDEALYYAWKIGTVGVAPALVTGKSFYGAAHESLKLLREEPWKAVGLRMGYSLVCWVIGIIAYVGALYYFMTFGGHIEQGKGNFIYDFYFLMAVPIAIAAGLTAVLVRPFYLIALSKLYTDVMPLEREVTEGTDDTVFNYLFIVFCVLLAGLLGLHFFGDELGIRSWVESLAAKDLAG